MDDLVFEMQDMDSESHECTGFNGKCKNTRASLGIKIIVLRLDTKLIKMNRSHCADF